VNGALRRTPAEDIGPDGRIRLDEALRRLMEAEDGGESPPEPDSA
jgi:hypothetical protein